MREPGTRLALWLSASVAAGVSDGHAQPRTRVSSADAMLSVGASSPIPSVYWPRGGRIAVADVDGDTTPDIVVGMPECEIYGCDGARAGKVVVYSGASREVIRTFRGRVALFGVATEGFGALVRAADLDGDGHAEVLVAAERRRNLANPGSPIEAAGGIDVFSGATGDLLYTLAGSLEQELLGLSFDVVGDVDGDSRPDLVVGSPGRRLNQTSGSPPKRCLSIYSGATGVRLFGSDDPAPGIDPDDLTCLSMVSVGDVNGDGEPEFATARYGARVAILTAAVPPRVQRAVDFGSGQSWPGTFASPSIYVAGCGDLTGDGLDDFVCFGRSGEPPYRTRLAAYAGIEPPGSDWETPLFSADLPGVYQPLFVVAAGDVNGDGATDLALGCLREVEGLFDSRVMILSGAGGGTLRTFVDGGWVLPQSSVLWDGGGAADFNGDGAQDFALARVRWAAEGELRTEVALFTTAPCEGDSNGDGVTDFVDLNAVLSDYGQSGLFKTGDVNADLVVDFLDLNDVLSWYGQACAE